ncbi:acyl carrier protein [Paraburkholderia tropica]|uniref:acyl carrier protein n=1 Tax=Paraburkholderia tropica TaxID=92647 RepID=UPI002AB60B24|nr:acyl carrier protein [Paraburkholderia tropica]
MQTNIEERVKKIIAEKMDIPATGISNGASLVADIGCDSLDLLELVMDVEDEFGLEISDEGAEKLQTVQQVIDYVMAEVAA